MALGGFAVKGDIKEVLPAPRPDRACEAMGRGIDEHDREIRSTFSPMLSSPEFKSDVQLGLLVGRRHGSQNGYRIPAGGESSGSRRG